MTPRLPEFAVESIAGADLRGRYEPSKWVGLGWGVALRVGDGFVRGEFAEVDEAAALAVVRVWNLADVDSIRPRESYPFLDLYWGDRAILVFDRSRQWHRTTFQPVDAVEQFTDGHRVLSKASPGTVADNVVRGGWDHEHCEICYETIGAQGGVVGWVSSRDEWLCERCYDAYLLKRSLGFVNVE